ncbi:MAG: EamA family transporter [Bacteroidota bacterium]
MAFAAVSIFWGTTFFAIRIGVESFPPFLMAAFRHSIGGILICSYFLLRGYSIPAWPSLKVFAINGFLMLVIGNGLVTWAEMYVSSGLAAIICSLTPIWIVGFNSFTKGKELLNTKIVTGFVLCLLAQLLIFKNSMDEFSNANYTMGIVFVLIANIAWALGSVYSKNHHTETHPLFGAGLQMISGGVTLHIIGASMGEWQHFSPNGEALWALAYLIVFGSILAYGCYMYILKNMPATIVSTYAYINTVVAVVMGWLWLNEQLTMEMFAGVLVTLSGLWLVNKGMNKA